MNKFEFLTESFKHRAYKRKEYLISVLTIGFDDPENKAILSKHPYCVWIEDGKYQFYDHAGVQQTLEGDVKSVIFRMPDHFDFPADFHPVLQGKAIRSTFGIMLFNIVLFYETVKHAIPYQNKELTRGMCIDWINKIAVDDPKEGETVPEGFAAMRDVLQISRNANYLEGILGAIVSCGSYDALTVHPSIVKRKAELLKEHKDHLNDPVVFNNIVEELVKMDTEIQMKGASATFYISKDYISNCRKRMFLIFGIEFNNESGQWVPIVDPLTKGWDPNLLNDYINTAIEGAYNRGKATGEGGARVKDLLRIISSMRVTDDDCGSMSTEPIFLLPEAKSFWAGSNILVGSKVVELTKDNYDQYAGRLVQMRAPQFCVTENHNFCKTCLGKGLGAVASRLSADGVKPATAMMLSRMKSSHISGTSNSDVKWSMAFR